MTPQLQQTKNKSTITRLPLCCDEGEYDQRFLLLLYTSYLFRNIHPLLLSQSNIKILSRTTSNAKQSTEGFQIVLVRKDSTLPIGKEKLKDLTRNLPHIISNQTILSSSSHLATFYKKPLPHLAPSHGSILRIKGFKKPSSPEYSHTSTTDASLVVAIENNIGKDYPNNESPHHTT